MGKVIKDNFSFYRAIVINSRRLVVNVERTKVMMLYSEALWSIGRKEVE